MVVRQTCTFAKENDERCRSAPLRGESFCFWHHPDYAEEAAKARQLGGLRRKREKALQGAYEVDGLETVEQIRRVVEIAVLDGLGLDNSVARCRVLIAGALAAAKLLEVGELEERLEAIEGALGPRVLPKQSGRGRR